MNYQRMQVQFIGYISIQQTEELPTHASSVNWAKLYDLHDTGFFSLHAMCVWTYWVWVIDAQCIAAIDWMRMHEEYERPPVSVCALQVADVAKARRPALSTPGADLRPAAPTPGG